MVREWRHIRMLKRHGRGNDSSGSAGTTVGDCVVHCLACPRPGINLSESRQSEEYVLSCSSPLASDLQIPAHGSTVCLFPLMLTSGLRDLMSQAIAATRV